MKYLPLVLIAACMQAPPVAEEEVEASVYSTPLVAVGDSLPPPPEEAGEERPPTVDAAAEVIPASAASGSTRRRRGRLQITPEMVWNVPDESGDTPTATGLLRICASETNLANVDECWALLQTIENIRSRRCSFEGSSRVTECANGEETLLSAMRRASRAVMGMVPARSSRQRWVRTVELDCGVPRGRTEEWWNRSQGVRAGHPSSMHARCTAASAMAVSAIMDGERKRVIRGAQPIAWGGRCESVCTDISDPSTCSNRGACDDSFACRRGTMHRIPGTEQFANAFWCRRGRGGCPVEVDPICRHFDTN